MLKKISLIILIVILGYISYFLLYSKFHAGDCVEANDGYIWHINFYRYGKYSVMGWQENGWGNEVKMDKKVLERKDLSGTPVYRPVSCPQYGI